MSLGLNDNTFAAQLQLDLPSGLRNAEEACTAAKAMAAQAWACDESEFELMCAPSVFVAQRLLVKGVPPKVYQAYRANALQKTKRRGLLMLMLMMLICLSAWLLTAQLGKQHELKLKLLTETTERLKGWKQNRDSRQAWSELLVHQWKVMGPKLEMDINPVFNAIEKIQEPQVRLRSLELETAARTATLAYELPSMAKVSALNSALLQQDSHMSCRLTGIQSVTQMVSAQWLCTF